MSKRAAGKFARRESDAYYTPLAAVQPLIPHLAAARVRRFAEPCCGGGDLVRHLESFGLRCVYRGDLAAGQDALSRDCYGEVDAIITNPPYARPVMHPLIAHFLTIAPTWLLLELDWAATRQASPFLRSCSGILSLGRLKWIEGSPSASFDNFAWFRFDVRHSSGPIYHTLDSVPDGRSTRICAQCGSPYRPLRSDGRFCSDTCRKRAQRARLVVT